MTWLRREPVPITLILEPLLFGFVPQSVVPVILVLLVAVSLALALLPHVVRYFDEIAAPFKQEIGHTKRE